MSSLSATCLSHGSLGPCPPLTGVLCLGAGWSGSEPFSLGYLSIHKNNISPRCYTVNHLIKISVTPKWHKAHQGGMCYNSLGFVEWMPTSKRRINLAVPQDLEEKLEKVAKAERRPLAGLCVHLTEEALELPRFREILHTGPRPDDEIIKGTGLDQLDVTRLQELQAVLKDLQELKTRQQS